MASQLEGQRAKVLGTVFDPHANALNVWRLIFASMVIMQHSWPLTGRRMSGPFTQLLTEVWVDGFFVISGYLITSSWMRRPKLREYLAARLLRIFPGLWVCVFVVAFVIAPIGVLVQHGEPLAFSSQLAWALNNGLLNVFHGDIDGTPLGVPWPGVWDGPLWTLIFELICYAAVAVLGVAGLMRKRWTIPTAFVISLIGAAAVGYPVLAVETIPQMVTRFALTFSAGALLYQFPRQAPRELAVGRAVRTPGRGRRPAAELPCFRRTAVGVRGRRVRRVAETVSATTAQRHLVRHLHLRLAGPTTAGDDRPGLVAARDVLCRRDRGHHSTGGSELVPRREARHETQAAGTDGRTGSAGYVHALGAQRRQQSHRLLGRRTRLRRVDTS